MLELLAAWAAWVELALGAIEEGYGERPEVQEVCADGCYLIVNKRWWCYTYQEHRNQWNCIAFDLAEEILFRIYSRPEEG